MKIAILSPDTIRIPLTENAPAFKYEGDVAYSLKDKCTRANAVGQRATNMATGLAEHFDVTVLVPDINFPGDAYVDYSKINFKIIAYSWAGANWTFSNFLDGVLRKFDVVIIQSTSGVGFCNVATLPKSIAVIVDGWVPFPVEFPCSLMSYDDDALRKHHWKIGISQYTRLMKRADLVLYANEAQGMLYDGFILELLGLEDMHYEKLNTMKVQNYIPNNYTKRQNESTDTHILWYGPIYPWYDPTELLKNCSKKQSVHYHFVGLGHPRYRKIQKLYETEYRSLFEKCPNVSVDYEYKDDPKSIMENYDAGIVIAKEWLENKYSNRSRILDMISYGLPVITNATNPLIQEPELDNVILGIDSDDGWISLLDPAFTEVLDINPAYFYLVYSEYSLENTLKPLVNYIKG